MKISKLFHWLYAFLMFLPVFFVAGRTFYTICNKNAYQSYSDNGLVQKSATFDNSNGLIQDEVYHFLVNDNFNGQSTIIYYSDISINWTDYGAPAHEYKGFQLYGNYIDRIYLLYYDDTYQYTTINIYNVSEFSFTFNSASNTNLFNGYTLYTYTYQKETLDNAFEYSMDSINDTPLFSWAQTSFLSAPMVYITGLFGMPNNSPVITLLSYWLSISIVWLVFDLVMYVPLLVHRWIDRGIVE